MLSGQPLTLAVTLQMMPAAVWVLAYEARTQTGLDLLALVTLWLVLVPP